MPYAKGRFYCSQCEFTNSEKMFVQKHIQQKHAGDGYPMTPWQRYHTEYVKH